MTGQTSITLPPRFLLFGLECQFTLNVLGRLIKKFDLKPAAVVLPGPPNFEGVLTTPSGTIFSSTATESVSSLCQTSTIPLLRAGDLLADRTQDQLARFHATFALVACFNRLLPEALIDQFPQGVFNMHPSLLPDLRGPDPLFWTFKRGDGRSGITVHQITPKFDAGPIIAQKLVTYADGTSETALEQELAVLGADLLAPLVPSIGSGSVMKRPQDHQRATWAPFPDLEDFRIDLNAQPRSIFNFVRGMRYREPDPWYEVDGQRFIAADTLEYGEGALPEPDTDGHDVVLKARDGWVRLQSYAAHLG